MSQFIHSNFKPGCSVIIEKCGNLTGMKGMISGIASDNGMFRTYIINLDGHTFVDDLICTSVAIPGQCLAYWTGDER